MPCPTCIKALQDGGKAVLELAIMHDEELPPLPVITTYRELSAVLINLAGKLRSESTPSTTTY